MTLPSVHGVPVVKLLVPIRLSASMSNAAAAPAHVELLLAGLAPHAGLVTIIDGHPASLAWLGAVARHRVQALG
ncbi:MAG TPA: hypothetical protein VJJ77_05165, partial [Dongiaceae bacterium]|nr:hypothetical protein [Dongiaceae bacterium]